MTRLFVPGLSIEQKDVILREDQARYLISVLRISVGEEITLFSDQGICFAATVIGKSTKEVRVKTTEIKEVDVESNIRISLFQGILKGEKMDLVVQKATELGINEIIPVITERCQIRETKKTARWRKIAEEASRQSGRTKIPGVGDVKSMVSACEKTDAGLIFWEEDGMNIKDAISRLKGCNAIDLFTGPEGGFSKAEVDMAKKCGYVVTSLGKRILRAETAAISAIAIIQHELGDMG